MELWENERWGGDAKGGNVWGKTYLRSGERSAWTRGRDGWGGIKEDGTGDVRYVISPVLHSPVSTLLERLTNCSSNLTFLLAPGWAFVETEDWRPDIEGTWVSPIGADNSTYLPPILSIND